MKKIVFLGIALLSANIAFAQKGKVNTAYNMAMMNTDLDAAKANIAEALANAETQNWAKTWYTAGFVEERLLEDQQKKEITQNDDKSLRGECVVKAYDYFVKTHELDILPDEKGAVKPKFTKQIVTYMKTYPNELFNYGIRLYQDRDFENSYNVFNRCSELPELPFMKGEVNASDSIYLWSAYYAADAALKADKKADAAKNLEKIKDLYQTENCYQLLASIYKETDTEKFVNLLKSNYTKQPILLYFLIDYYFTNQKMDEANAILEQSLKKEPNNTDFLFLKGNYEMQKENYAGAREYFGKVIGIDSKNAAAHLAIGRTYYIAGQDIEEEADKIKDYKASVAKNKEAQAEYEKAAGYLESVHKLEPENKENLRMLRSIYYKLRKDAEYEKIEKELNAL